MGLGRRSHLARLLCLPFVGIFLCRCPRACPERSRRVRALVLLSSSFLGIFLCLAPAASAQNLQFITVSPNPVDPGKPATATVAVNQTYQFNATGHYDDGSTQNLTLQATWTSLNTAAATISNSGVASGVAVGSATITATLGSFVGSANINVVAGAQTAVTLSVLSNPITYPGSTTLIAKVSPGAGSTGGATVYFYDLGVTNYSSLLDATGTATMQYPCGGCANAGTHSIVAVFGGNASYAPSVSNLLVETVNKQASITVFLGCNPNPVSSGQQLNCSACTSTYGSIQVNDGSTVISTVTPTGSGGALQCGSNAIDYGFPLSLSPGSHSLTATYSGDTNDAPSTSAPYTETVIFAKSIAVTPAPSSVPNGGTVQFAATATFSDNSTQNVTSAAGVTWSSSQSTIATVSATGLAASGNPGTTVISASYQGVSGSSNLTVTPPSKPFVVGKNPVAVAAGDFNRDGKLDLAVVDQGSNSVAILLGNGGGVFANPVFYAVGTTPTSIAVGDFNNDGKLDLIVGNTGAGANDLSLLIGNGDGTFQSAVSLNSGQLGVFSIGVSDLNNDGKPDIVVGAAFANVGVRLGNGDGTFQPPASYSGTCSAPVAIAISDYNRDGVPDVAAGQPACGPAGALLLGTGSGSFQAPLMYSFLGGAYVAAGDFNLDAKPDLAMGYNSGTGKTGLAVALGNGNGAFQAAVQVNPPPAPDSADSFTNVGLVDLNGDGKPDIVAVDQTTGQLAVAYGNGDGTFQTPLNYAAGTQPDGLAVGDFNRDGTDDLVAVNFADGTLSYVPGTAVPNPNLSFRQTLTYNAGTNSRAVAIGDFERNGNPDLLVANSGSNNVTLEHNLGSHNGLFTPAATPIAVGTTPVAIASADLNHDGVLDFVTADSGSNTVTVMLGDGAGNFSAALGSPHTLAASPNSVAIGDLDHNGAPDLAVANGSNVSVLLGAGDGTFSAPVNWPAGPFASSVVMADFNKDGIMDLAVANAFNTGTVSVLLGNGSGTFKPPVAYTLPGGGPSAWSLAVGDFNRDGNPDIAVADVSNNVIDILIGKGDGTFTTVVAGNLPPNILPSIAGGLAVGDFNHDGKPDLAVTNGNQVSFLLGNGDGTFQAPVSFPGSTSGSLLGAGLAVGDLNADGKDDIVVANNVSSGAASVLLNNSGSNLPSKNNIGAGTNPNAIATGDFNEDGRSDLAIVNSGSNNITVELGNGDGTFGSPQSITVGNKPVAIAAGHLTSSGHLDLAVVNNTDGTVNILLGDGHGNFAGPPNGIPAVLIVDASPTSIVMEDLNHDGKLDLAISYAQTQTVTIFFGNGDGSFQPKITYVAPPGPISTSAMRASAATGVSIGPRMIAAADFTGNGNKDLAVVRPFSDSVTVLFNDGTGHFPTTASYNVNTLPLGVAAGDFHGTGKADIAVLNTGASSITLLANDGTGKFPNQSTFATGTTPLSIIALDFNGDGKIDLAWVNSGDNSVTLLPGKGDGTFNTNAEETVAAGTVPYDMVIGSFTGGGTNDLAVANNTSNNVSIILNLGANAVSTVSSANPAVYNTPLVFNSSVSGTVSGTGIPKGTITYLDGSSVLGTANLSGAGQTTFQVPVTLTVGAHAIHASYSGDGFFLANTGTFTETIESAPTATQLTPSVSTITYGQQVTFTANVTAQAGAPTGNVTFCDGAVTGSTCNGTTLGMASLSGGQAAFTTTTPLSVGTHNVTALYGGAVPLFGTSNSTSVAEVVSQATTNTTLLSSNPTPAYGVQVIFTAQVSSSAPVKPTGTVTFCDGTFNAGSCAGTVIGSSPLNANGQASVTDSTLSVGAAHSIMANYPGDSNFGGSTSGATTVTVQKGTSATGLVSSKKFPVLGDSVSFTATVTPPPATPGESVTFTDNGAPLGSGSATLNSSGVATLATTSLTLGFHAILANYAGDNNASGSTSNEVDVIVLKASTTALISSKNPSTYGDQVTFTATVQGAGGGTPSDGTVTFFDSTTPLAQPVALGNNGQATLPISTLAVGTHAISATYNGGLTFGPSTGTLSGGQLVNNVPNLSVSVGHPAALAHVGQPLVFTVTVNDVMNSTANVNLTASFTGVVAVLNAQTDFGGPCAGTGPVLCLLGNMNQGNVAHVTFTVIPAFVGNVGATVSTNTSTATFTDGAKVRPKPFRH